MSPCFLLRFTHR